ncbi:hypothetical protein [Actinomadura formosensis]|uniref:hypothetical protein n=1 Tax=Actinomadura formosensis TaxID=60706 RepID=UPI001041827A|nr:hypothetical protein [Actinomadura formosensis]
MRRKVVFRAMSPFARIRTVYVRVRSGPVVLSEIAMSMTNRTAGVPASRAASADGLISGSGTVIAAPAAIAPQRVLRRTGPPSGLLYGCQGGGDAAPGTEGYCHVAKASNVHPSGNSLLSHSEINSP